MSRPESRLPKIVVGEAIEDFLSTLTDIADRTVARKRRVLELLVKQLPKGRHTLTRNLKEIYFNDCIKDIGRGADEHEADARMRKGWSPRRGQARKSLKNDTATLRQFAEHLKYRKWALPEFNPVYEIVTAAREHGKQDPRARANHKRIPLADWPRLLDAAAHPRDRLLVAFGLWFARRADDLSYLQWKHIDRDDEMFPNGSIYLFNGKGGRPVAGGRPLPIWPEVAVELDRYLAWFVPLYGEPQPDWPLFAEKLSSAQTPGRDVANWPVSPSKPATAWNIGRTVKRVLQGFGWSGEDLRGEGAHTLRRSGLDAVDELVDGNTALAQMLADHKSIDQTMHYTGRNKQYRQLSAVMVKAAGNGPESPSPVIAEEPAPAVTQKEETNAVVIDFASRRRVA